MRFIRTFESFDDLENIMGGFYELGLIDPYKAVIKLQYPVIEEELERDFDGQDWYWDLFLISKGVSISELEIDFYPAKGESWSLTILKKIAAEEFKLTFDRSHIWDQSNHKDWYVEIALKILEKIQKNKNIDFEIFCQDRSSFGLPESQENSSNPLVGWSDLVFEKMYSSYIYLEFQKHEEAKKLDDVREMFFSGEEKAECLIKIWSKFPGPEINPNSQRWQTNFGN